MPSVRGRLDVFLRRTVRREAASVEIWDYFEDVGASMRGFEDKVSALRRHLDVGHDMLQEPWREHPGRAMPETPGLVGTDWPGTRLLVARL